MYRRFAIFGFGNIFSSIIPFVLLPFLTNNINPAEMGEIAFLESVLLILAPLITFGVDGFYSVSFNKVREGKLGQLNYNLSLIPIFLSVALLPIVLLLLLLEFLPLGISNWFIVLIIPVCAFQAITALAYSHFQMKGAAVTYALNRVGVGLVNVSVTVFFISILGLTLEGRIIGIYSGFVAGGILSLLVLRTNGVFDFFRIRLDYLKRALKFGVGMVAHSWSGIIFFTSDRIILGYLVEQNELGVYAISAQIGMAMSIVQTTFSQIWVPHAFRVLSKKLKKKFIKDSVIVIILLFVTALVFILVTPLIYRYFVNEKYSGLVFVSYWTIAAYFFLGVYKIFVVKLFYFEKTKLLAIITSFSALLNVILTLLLVSEIGAIGAAIATCISSFVFASLVLVISLKLNTNEICQND